MSLLVYRCARCRKQAAQERGAVNRARRRGMRLFCGRRCAGMARRSGKTKAQRVEEKRLYDAAYREQNRALLKAKKRAYFERTYDPAKAAIERKRRAPQHAEYCRRPEYVAYKREYDKQYRAREFGPFAECYLLLQDLNAEIASRMSKYDIYMANGRYDKYAERRRERRLANG